MLRSEDNPIVLVEEVTDFGMITLKADFFDDKIRALVKKTLDIEVPKANEILFSNKLSIAWMSADECAIILKDYEAQKMSLKIGLKMKDYHHLCANMSDSRRCFRLLGVGWREVLSKGSPIDFHPSVFCKGSFRRTRLSAVPVAIWAVSDKESYIFSMQSVGDFVREWLKVANLKSGELNFYSE